MQEAGMGKVDGDRMGKDIGCRKGNIRWKGRG